MKASAQICMLFLSLFAVATFAPAQTPALRYRIAGTVVSRTDGHPLARARVAIVNVKDAKQTASVVTSDDGKYEFTGLLAGKYSLTGAKRGYLPAGYNQHEIFWTAIVTGAGFDTENLTLRLWPAAYIVGKVLDENGDPVRSAAVHLYHSFRSEGMSRIEQINGTNTNDLGEYEFGPETVGTYFIATQAMPWYAIHPVTRQQDASAPPAQVDSTLDVAYPITYYGDVTNSDSATPIELHGDRAQADIHLNAVPALHVFFQSGESQNNGLQLMQPSFGESLSVPGASAQPVGPGVWEMTGFPPGTYSVRAWNQGYQSELKRVDLVNDGDELDTSGGIPPSTVKFQVSMADETSLPAQLFVGLRLPNGKMNRAAPVDSKGEVQLQQVPQGSYEVFAGNSSRGYSVAQITSKDAEVSGHLLNVPAGSSISASLTLFSRMQDVEGFAKKDGKGFAGAMVILVPQDPATHPDLFRRDQTDLDGSFDVKSVVPGVYTIIAIEDGWDLDWMQPGVLTPYLKGAQEIDVRNQHSLSLSQAVGVQAK